MNKMNRLSRHEQRDALALRSDGSKGSKERLIAAIWTILVVVFIFIAAPMLDAAQQQRTEFAPVWESILWGGSPAKHKNDPSIEHGPLERNGHARVHYKLATADSDNSHPLDTSPQDADAALQKMKILEILGLYPESTPDLSDPKSGSADEVTAPDSGENTVVKDLPLLENIPPLYATPPLENEGVWDSSGLPTDKDGAPLMYRTSYRPSERYPNAIVHMLLFDMKRVSMRLYLGSSEPGATPGSSIVKPEDRQKLVAITNALWKQKHSGQAGTVFGSRVIKNLFPGMATLVIYQDSSVDIIEWSPDIPLEFVNDAKQLRHLIVKDGKVVSTIPVNGKISDSEIGLGYLLSESEPMPGYDYWGSWWGQPSYTTTSGPEWFLATRSAFGIRNDGNLVFAVGHHISTKDLAKALVLAGCQRAIHGDANPHNVVGNIYFPDGNGRFARKEKLSPDQKTYTLDRYVDRSYTSDFFAFFRRDE
ncbi:MAG: hypothetical protein ACP5M0_05700 [Desulfomonilaceae bacterium]